MSEKLVTIAIPIYNAMPYLQDAILSVINQTYKNWVLYLINDGSTDGSLLIAKKYAELDNRIILLNDGLNQGLVYRLNQSVSLCTSKYYARMDADDIMCITRIEQQVRFMETHPNVLVCGSSIMTIDNKNNIIGSRYRDGIVESFFHPTVFGRTEWFRNNPYSNWALRAEDMELWLRTSADSVFYSINKPLLFYREFGIPTFEKYRQSQLTVIRLALRYNDYNKSIFWCLKMIVTSYLKIIISFLLNLFGNLDLLVAMRRADRVPEHLVLTEYDLLLSIKNE